MTLMTILGYSLLVVATFPFIYYLIVLYSSWRFFRRPFEQASSKQGSFTPPVSNLKPVRGLDPDAYENFASFCLQDYPDYELLFCVGDKDAPVVPVLEKLARDFPERRIRILFGGDGHAINDKVGKLSRLVREAQHETLVINDSDVRVRPDYLRTVVAPLADPKVGAVTCFYIPIDAITPAQKLQTIGMISDFYAGILAAWQLDGVKFALGPTIATTRTQLEAFGGYRSLESRPADDLLVGRLIAERGFEVRLLPYTIQTVPDYASMPELIHKRIRWLAVMRHMRPWGHLGLLFTQGLPWSLAAFAIHPTVAVGCGYLGTYLGLRLAMTWLIGARGLRDQTLRGRMWLLPVWDAMAFLLWLASFGKNSFQWRGGEYRLRNGQLVPGTPHSSEK
jgi:ceramide glucosyltransferase